MLYIIGSGMTAILHDWEAPGTRWSVGSCSAYGNKIDLYFSLHQGQDIGVDNQIKLGELPIDDIKKYAGSDYFNNSIAYMIVYAVMNGYVDIELYGVDAEQESEYAFERPCLAYWVGWARAKDVNIKTSSGIGDGLFKYGYQSETLSNAIDFIKKRAEAYRRNALISDGAQKEQYIGAMFALDRIAKLLKG